MNILLHICCAVCATACLERLRQEGHDVSGYFCNPNIQPRAEYLKRLQEIKKLARGQNLPLLVDDYELDSWFTQTGGLESEPEGGRRCSECFKIRLEKTARQAKKKKFDAFTTTLTISPHKNFRLINEIGQDIGNGLFLARDFKKQNGFQRAQQLARQHNLYHQNYCGCIYSLNKAIIDERLHKETCPSGHKD